MSMNGDLVSQKDLEEWSGLRGIRLKKWCIENGIQIFVGKSGQITTTLRAINEALLGTSRKRLTEPNFRDLESNAQKS